MSDLNRSRLQAVLIVVFFTPICFGVMDANDFTFGETLGISPWLVVGAVLSIAVALAIYGNRKKKT